MYGKSWPIFADSAIVVNGCVVLGDFVMSLGSSDDSDDAGRSSLKQAGLPVRFGKRDRMDRSFHAVQRRRSSMYADADLPTTKYDLMTSAERREEQSRIEADVKQVLTLSVNLNVSYTIIFYVLTYVMLHLLMKISDS